MTTTCSHATFGALGFFVCVFAAASALAQNSPCPNFDPPRLEMRDIAIEPDVPVPLPALFKMIKGQGRQPNWFALCARRFDTEKYDLEGVTFQPTNRAFDIACMDIEGTNLKTGSNYGVPWSAVNIRFPESERGRIVPLSDWTLVYEFTGDDIPFGGWSCQSPPINVQVPVGFNPDIVMLSPLSLWNRGAQVTPEQILQRSNFLTAGRATAISADESAAGLIVYRVGQYFEQPVQLTVTGDGSMVGTLESFTSNFLDRAPGGGSASLTIPPAQFRELRDTLGQMSKFAIAIYRAPRPADGLASSGGAMVTVTASNGEDVEEVALPVKGPPILLIHGLWGDASTFGGWPQVGTAPYVNHFYQTMVYGGASSYRDDGNQNNLQVQLELAQERMQAQGVIGTRVDAVTHSMGGLIVRQYMSSSAYTSDQYYNTPTLYRLVTLDTPHTGSPIATVLWTRRNDPVIQQSDCSYTSAGGLLICAALKLRLADRFTLSDLAVGIRHPISSAIEHLQPSEIAGAPLATPASAPGGFMTVSGRASSYSPMGAAITIALRRIGALSSSQTISDLFVSAGEGPGLHDVIVGESSQRAFASVASFAPSPFQGVDHVQVTKDDSVKARVWCWLRHGNDCAAASANHTAGQLAKARTLARSKVTPAEFDLDLSARQRSNAAGTIALDSPLQKGWRGSFVITVPGKQVAGAYLFADSNFSDGEMFYASQPSVVDWVRVADVPVPDAEQLNVSMLVLFRDNTYDTYSGTYPIELAPLVNYQQHAFTAPFVVLGQAGDTAQIGIQAQGNSGTVSFPLTGLTFVVEPATDPAVSVNSSGLVTALRAGSARISTTFANNRRIALPVTVAWSPTTSVPTRPLATITGVQFEQGEPRLSLSATVGSSTEAEVSIGNQGTAALSVGAISWETNAAALTIMSNACSGASVAASATCTFRVRFAPTAAGSTNVTLAVATNDTSYPTIPVAVTATASAAPPPPPPPPPPGSGPGGSGGSSSGGGGGGGGSSHPFFILALVVLLLGRARMNGSRRHS